MDVSESDQTLASVAPLLDGPKLLHTVVSLTGLPEEMIYEELDQILKLKEQDTEELTLDGLRAAMLAYLETIQANMGDSPESDQT